LEEAGYRVEGRCMSGHAASARVMEKAGMAYGATLGQRGYTGGAYRDMEVYSVLRREWGGSA